MLRVEEARGPSECSRGCSPSDAGMLPLKLQQQQRESGGGGCCCGDSRMMMVMMMPGSVRRRGINQRTITQVDGSGQAGPYHHSN